MALSRTITDARGNRVPVYPLQTDWQSREPTLPEPVFADLRARFINTGFLGLGLPAWMLWLLVALHLLLIAAAVLMRNSPPVLAALGAALVVTYLGYWLTHKRQVPTPNPEELAEALLRHHRCPSCAYDLDVAPRDSDGLITCPECGAGWKAVRDF